MSGHRHVSVCVYVGVTCGGYCLGHWGMSMQGALRPRHCTSHASGIGQARCQMICINCLQLRTEKITVASRRHFCKSPMVCIRFKT